MTTTPRRLGQDVIIAHLDVLFTYAQRFYERQFLTRKISSSKLLKRLDDLLTDHVNGGELIINGLPTVQQLAESLAVSPKYMSSLVKQLTGQTTQQLIHQQLIDRAKERLSTTELSVSEIAYELGFEHPQSFNKLFKAKTNQVLLAFRASFN